MLARFDTMPYFSPHSTYYTLIRSILNRFDKLSFLGKRVIGKFRKVPAPFEKSPTPFRLPSPHLTSKFFTHPFFSADFEKITSSPLAKGGGVKLWRPVAWNGLIVGMATDVHRVIFHLYLRLSSHIQSLTINRPEQYPLGLLYCLYCWLWTGILPFR